MHQALSLETIPIGSTEWSRTLEEVRVRLGAPRNPLLFPAHFLQSAFPKIGGLLIEIKQGGRSIGYAFLFPRLPAGRRAFTVRLHTLAGVKEIDGNEVVAKLAESLPASDFVLCTPQLCQTYTRDEMFVSKQGISFGQPDEREAIAARRLQREVWGYETDDFLYPIDLYSKDFGAATSLVARSCGNAIGFLFGFYKFDSSLLPSAWQRNEAPLRIESQVAGVHPQYQQHGIGFLLKKLQAERAAREGIYIINWTADPLQAPNASLNFKNLRAVSFRFLPDHYNFFKSDLNRVRASRLEITWLLLSPRAQRALAERRHKMEVDLKREHNVAILNDGPRPIPFKENTPRIAIEIPENWKALQASDFAEAELWRNTTDELLEARLGSDEGKYMITDIGKKGTRRYLVARRVDRDFPGDISAF